MRFCSLLKGLSIIMVMIFSPALLRAAVILDFTEVYTWHIGDYWGSTGLYVESVEESVSGQISKDPSGPTHHLQLTISGTEKIIQKKTQKQIGTSVLNVTVQAPINVSNPGTDNELWYGDVMVRGERRETYDNGETRNIPINQMFFAYIPSEKSVSSGMTSYIAGTITTVEGKRENLTFGLKYVRRVPEVVNGDFNFDGCFDSSDLVYAFVHPGTLDINKDGSFTDDLVRLFQEGHYEKCN